MPRHGLQQNGPIFRGPGHWPGMVEAESERQNTGAANPTVGWFDSRYPAKRRRGADRTGGFGARPTQDQARRHGCAGAA